MLGNLPRFSLYVLYQMYYGYYNIVNMEQILINLPINIDFSQKLFKKNI